MGMELEILVISPALVRLGDLFQFLFHTLQLFKIILIIAQYLRKMTTVRLGLRLAQEPFPLILSILYHGLQTSLYEPFQYDIFTHGWPEILPLNMSSLISKGQKREPFRKSI